MDVIFALVAVSAALPALAVLVIAVQKNAHLADRERARALAFHREAFEARQAKAREELAEAKLANFALAAGISVDQAIDPVAAVPRRASAREPESKPADPYRFPDVPCARCRKLLKIGDRAVYDPAAKLNFHGACWRAEESKIAPEARRPLSGGPAPRSAPRRSPPPAPVTHGSHRSVEETGSTPLAAWDAREPISVSPPIPPAPSYDSGVTASGYWSDSSSSSSSSDTGSSGCDASGSW